MDSLSLVVRDQPQPAQRCLAIRVRQHTIVFMLYIDLTWGIYVEYMWFLDEKKEFILQGRVTQLSARAERGSPHLFKPQL